MNTTKGTRRPAKKHFKKIVKVSKTNYNRLRYKTHSKRRVLELEGLHVDYKDFVRFANEDGETDMVHIADVGIQMKVKR